ncbi:hypothetical protein EYF80_025914 [Liparis tanakae]|uniref:Uncharacterized protein n=1 Tax=Liparis tanakae TaxID=230148 RepID=A0A4Z2HEY2_9TELE|nr:hypothetical protein EYF80_025914 [Liparis tanakae]
MVDEGVRTSVKTVGRNVERCTEIPMAGYWQTKGGLNRRIIQHFRLKGVELCQLYTCKVPLNLLLVHHTESQRLFGYLPEILDQVQRDERLTEHQPDDERGHKMHQSLYHTHSPTYGRCAQRRQVLDGGAKRLTNNDKLRVSSSLIPDSSLDSDFSKSESESEEASLRTDRQDKETKVFSLVLCKVLLFCLVITSLLLGISHIIHVVFNRGHNTVVYAVPLHYNSKLDMLLKQIHDTAKSMRSASMKVPSFFCLALKAMEQKETADLIKKVKATPLLRMLTLYTLPPQLFRPPATFFQFIVGLLQKLLLLLSLGQEVHPTHNDLLL